MLETTAAIVLAESDGIGWLLALGPVGAASFYWAVWMAYRNTDKSHAYEHETHIVVSNMTGDDIKVGTNNGTRDSRIQGKNSDKPRERV